MKSIIVLLMLSLISWAESINNFNQEFQKALEKRVKEFEAVGGVLAVNLKGDDYFHSYGCAKLSLKAMKRGVNYSNCEENMSLEHKFKIGSVTKTITANIILSLIQEKKLNFDTKVSEVLDLNMSNYDLSEITIRELLTHTSGLFNFTKSRKWLEAYIYNTTKKFTIDELFKMVDLEKGKDGVQYSNSNYLFLGKIIEKITNQSFEESVDKILTKALNSHNFVILRGLYS